MAISLLRRLDSDRRAVALSTTGAASLLGSVDATECDGTPLAEETRPSGHCFGASSRDSDSLSHPEHCPLASALRGNRMTAVLPGKPRPFKDQQRSMSDGVFLTTNRMNFHEWGSGFAGEFYLRSYSCLFAKFVVRIVSTWPSEREGLDFLIE